MPSNRDMLSKLQYLIVLSMVHRLLDMEFGSTSRLRGKGIYFEYSERSHRAEIAF